jgi:aspartyl-tRNA(Asn)/glutamyl-tRNA(Gln) amidotransferase subunit B
VDLNRAGMALMEIVSEPDIRSIDEAEAYIRSLSNIIQHIGTCKALMAEGTLRADVNVSMRK